MRCMVCTDWKKRTHYLNESPAVAWLRCTDLLYKRGEIVCQRSNQQPLFTNSPIGFTLLPSSPHSKTADQMASVDSNLPTDGSEGQMTSPPNLVSEVCPRSQVTPHSNHLSSQRTKSNDTGPISISPTRSDLNFVLQHSHILFLLWRPDNCIQSLRKVLSDYLIEAAAPPPVWKQAGRRNARSMDGVDLSSHHPEIYTHEGAEEEIGPPSRCSIPLLGFVGDRL